MSAKKTVDQFVTKSKPKPASPDKVKAKTSKTTVQDVYAELYRKYDDLLKDLQSELFRSDADLILHYNGRQGVNVLILQVLQSMSGIGHYIADPDSEGNFPGKLGWG